MNPKNERGDRDLSKARGRAEPPKGRPEQAEKEEPAGEIISEKKEDATTGPLPAAEAKEEAAPEPGGSSSTTGPPLEVQDVDADQTLGGTITKTWLLRLSREALAMRVVMRRSCASTWRWPRT